MTESTDPSTPQPLPLAEGRWLWRRVYVFSISLGLWKLMADVVRAATPEILPRISDGLMALLGLLLILYLVAPTAQQLLELMADMRLRLGGIATNWRSGR